MQELVINGPTKWHGEVNIDGAKNACLPIMAALLMIDNQVTLNNIPKLNDIESMLKLLQCMGLDMTHQGQKLLSFRARELNYVAPYELVKKMRASILVLGPLLAKLGKAEVALPGGCLIGARPVDQHLEFMRALGAKVEIKDGLVCARADNGLTGCQYTFDVVSVTGTENAIMAASLAKGSTVIDNAAIEPEVIALIDFLNQCGAKISVSGMSVSIEGVTSLKAPAESFSVIGDRIEAGTFLIGAMICQGSILVKGICPEHLSLVIELMKKAGAQVEYSSEEQWIRLSMNRRPIAQSITTEVYPGFPTDLQAQWMALACVAEGESVIKEQIFENRMMHACELMRMGAKIKISSNTVTVQGIERLRSAPVMASDLRASASLVLAACQAMGESVIQRIYHIDRGYAQIESKLQALGVKVVRKETVTEN